MWTARLFTLYPKIFRGPLKNGLYGKALEKKIWNLEVVNIRDSADDKHKTVDDTPFGGGCGMLLKPDVIGKSLDKHIKKNEKITAIKRYRQYMKDRDKEVSLREAKDWVDRLSIKMDLD